MTETVNIRPGVSVLGVLRHLNYRPWYALGEFVDNSVESYVQNSRRLTDLHDSNYRLQVDIDIERSPASQIVIRDNACGIHEHEYARAFRPAALPPDRTGLAEFGMGMKSAACWFSPRWTVRTSALGEPVVREIAFDISQIVSDDIEELAIRETPTDRSTHFTEIILDDVFNPPTGGTIPKLKTHLTDIYRSFIRDGVLDLRFMGETLQYEEPKVLDAPLFSEPDADPRTWRKAIEFDFGNDLSVTGFAALRETASTARAGFALFRHKRVIQGSGDEGYRPQAIFGRSNSYRYQRLFGELHLEGFDVSHTKDGFRWDENEQPFLELLREHLNSADLPLLDQAEKYRVRRSAVDFSNVVRSAVGDTTRILRSHLADAANQIASEQLVETATETPDVVPAIAVDALEFQFGGQMWKVAIELSDHPAPTNWLELADIATNVDDLRQISIRLTIAHPFMVRFAHNDSEVMDALVRVAVGIAISEILAKEGGVKYAGTIRRNLNQLLLSTLSHP